MSDARPHSMTYVDNDMPMCVISDLKRLKSFWLEKCVGSLCYCRAVGQYWLSGSVVASAERLK